MKLLKKLLALVLAGMTAVNTGTAAFAENKTTNDVVVENNVNVGDGIGY